MVYLFLQPHRPRPSRYWTFRNSSRWTKDVVNGWRKIGPPGLAPDRVGQLLRQILLSRRLSPALPESPLAGEDPPALHEVPFILMDRTKVYLPFI